MSTENRLHTNNRKTYGAEDVGDEVNVRMLVQGRRIIFGLLVVRLRERIGVNELEGEAQDYDQGSGETHGADTHCVWMR